MSKFTTARQLQTAISQAFTLRVTVGVSGEVSERILNLVLDTRRYKATFWGFDSAGNNIVQIKLT